MDEVILAVHRKDFPEHWLGKKYALSIGWEQFINVMSSACVHFIGRAMAEHNPEFKQIIPYILLADSDNRLAAYHRNGSEKRLSGRMSIGIGGHLRPDDFTDGRFSWAELGGKALQRELLEELPGFKSTSAPEFLGIINEEQSAVGQVHLGIVFVIRGIDPDSVVSGEELGSLSWVSLPELTAAADKSFELWSLLALQLFDVWGRPF